jgi:hypothetical protein
MTGDSFPVVRIALERAVRLVATARLRDPVLLKLAGAAYQDDLAEIEGATNGRLQAQQQGSGNLHPGELVVGLPHAAFVNAAFSYWRPRELNRFNGPDRGAWYSALEVETAKSEVAFHIARELERVDDYNAVVEYAEMFASFAGEYVELRNAVPRPHCLHPAVGYPAGNAVADAVRAAGQNGIIYPSVRRPGGACLVALWPAAVQSVAQGQVLRAAWKGHRTPEWTVVS